MKPKTEKASMADMGEYTHAVSAETVSAGMSLLSCSNNKSSVLIQYVNRNDPSPSSHVFSEKVQFHPLMETLPTSPMI